MDQITKDIKIISNSMNVILEEITNIKQEIKCLTKSLSQEVQLVRIELEHIEKIVQESISKNKKERKREIEKEVQKPIKPLIIPKEVKYEKGSPDEQLFTELLPKLIKKQEERFKQDKTKEVVESKE